MNQQVLRAQSGPWAVHSVDGGVGEGGQRRRIAGLAELEKEAGGMGRRQEAGGRHRRRQEAGGAGGRGSWARGAGEKEE